MNYEQMRCLAKDGDVLLSEGRGAFSTLIRAVTAQQISHVALLLWLADGLFVAEMLERKGYVITPASQRLTELQQRGYIYYGEAPKRVRGRPEVATAALALRASRYSRASLFTVWLAQITGRRLASRLVCSTFVQRCWEAVDFRFRVTPDPGDYLRLCRSVTLLGDEPE